MTKEFGRAAAGLVTKAERDQRIAARPKPRAELHLTPQGWEATQVRRQIDQESERRIRHIDERLKTARDNFKNNHTRALSRGRAKQDFDRGR
jgi:DNA-binding PadR family transcriptional regulator